MERLDKLDIEVLDLMVRGRGWELFRARATEMRAAVEAEVLGATNWESFVQARARLTTIERLLDIPYILRQEAKNANVS